MKKTGPRAVELDRDRDHGQRPARARSARAPRRRRRRAASAASSSARGPRCCTRGPAGRPAARSLGAAGAWPRSGETTLSLTCRRRQIGLELADQLRLDSGGGDDDPVDRSREARAAPRVRRSPVPSSEDPALGRELEVHLAEHVELAPHRVERLGRRRPGRPAPAASRRHQAQRVTAPSPIVAIAAATKQQRSRRARRGRPAGVSGSSSAISAVTIATQREDRPAPRRRSGAEAPGGRGRRGRAAWRSTATAAGTASARRSRWRGPRRAASRSRRRRGRRRRAAGAAARRATSGRRRGAPRRRPRQSQNRPQVGWSLVPTAGWCARSGIELACARALAEPVAFRAPTVS